MNVRYRVTLDAEEREALEAMVRGGKAAARRIKRAQILLAADRGSTDEAIAANVAVGRRRSTARSGGSWRRASTLR
jgi:hypothetical protein